MRIDMQWPNGEPRIIESLDPGLIGQWLTEQFSRYARDYGDESNAPPLYVRVFPSWVRADDGSTAPDWVSTNAIISTYGMVRTPQEFLDVLAGHITQQAEREAASDAAV